MSRKNDENLLSRIILISLRFFYALLYHQFAWSYDLIAWIVSGGKWIEWLYAIFPYLNGKQVLELGHGPGHLQVKLTEKGYTVFGVDSSHQMISQAKKRLAVHGFPVRLTRAAAENLPFSPHSFECVFATFPTEYIFKGETVQEISRVLKPEGKFIALIGVKVFPQGIYNRFLSRLYRTSRQDIPDENIIAHFLLQLENAGLGGQINWQTNADCQLLIIVCSKEENC